MALRDTVSKHDLLSVPKCELKNSFAYVLVKRFGVFPPYALTIISVTENPSNNTFDVIYDIKEEK